MSVPAEVAPAKAAGGLPGGSHHLVKITKIYELPGTRPRKRPGLFFARVAAAVWIEYSSRSPWWQIVRVRCQRCLR
jgi:hypothetical protein